MSSNRLIAALLVSSAALLASTAHAADHKPASKSCGAATQSAWFERQREITEGNADPFQSIATPAECRELQAAKSDDAASRKQVASREEAAMPR